MPLHNCSRTTQAGHVGELGPFTYSRRSPRRRTVSRTFAILQPYISLHIIFVFPQPYYILYIFVFLQLYIPLERTYAALPSHHGMKYEVRSGGGA